MSNVGCGVFGCEGCDGCDDVGCDDFICDSFGCVGLLWFVGWKVGVYVFNEFVIGGWIGFVDGLIWFLCLVYVLVVVLVLV